MIDELDRLVDEITSLNSKLVLLIGAPMSGKSDLLLQLAARRQTRVLKVGETLGRRLLATNLTRRPLVAADILKNLAEDAEAHGLLLMDNIEILFDRSLQLNPLDLLRRNSHARRVVAAWPGELHSNRLSYASKEHPENRDYGVDGLIPLIIH